MSIINSVLALGESVPELDGLVAGSRDDLSVVLGEGNSEDITGMTLEGAHHSARVQVPETERLVPRTRQGELPIARDDHVRDSAVVSREGLPRVSVLLLLRSQLPHDELL